MFFYSTASATTVAVVAHSVSTSMEARRILGTLGWSETTNLRQADGILVVCRSMMFQPLNFSYDCFQELDRDTSMQMNITGNYMHIYIYQFEDDLRVSQVEHKYYETDK